MHLKTLAGIFAIALFVAYFGPIVIKLKDLPLTAVVVGGIVMVAIDVWESLTDQND